MFFSRLLRAYRLARAMCLEYIMARNTNNSITLNSGIINATNPGVSHNMYQDQGQNAYHLHPMHAPPIPDTDHPQINLPHLNPPPAAQNQQVPFNIRNITCKQKDDEPERYRGYHDFCKWMSTDRDFYVLRQFSETSVRVALFMQHEIMDLEKQLRDVDEYCMKYGIPSSTFKFDEDERRQRILPRLAESIRNYHQFIINQRLLQQSGCAADFQIKNVKQWLKDANQPIRDEEAAFIDKKRDLISVLVPDRTRFRRFLERFNIVNRFLPKQKEILEEFAPDDFERYTAHPTNSSHLDRVVFYTIVFIGVGMLIAPLWWLNYLAVHGPNLAPRLGVITGFLIAFVLLICFLTNARPFEVLAATAAYGAVLMVFIQLQQPN